MDGDSWRSGMRSTARIHNAAGEHHVKISTGDRAMTLDIDPKPSGLGSNVSGGELLMLALATCFCNDVYREAAKMGIDVTHVDVECGGDFPAEGEPARDITYSARITAAGPEARVRELAAHVDRIAEIHNSLRASIPVSLAHIEVDGP
jgi:organic hydroperoxide reductase OsmC/OhrA